MTHRAGISSDTRFLLVVLSGMMLYLCLATAGFAFLGFTGILPDMTQHFSWLTGTAAASGVVSLVSALLSRRKIKTPPARKPKA